MEDLLAAVLRIIAYFALAWVLLYRPWAGHDSIALRRVLRVNLRFLFALFVALIVIPQIMAPITRLIIGNPLPFEDKELILGSIKSNILVGLTWAISIAIALIISVAYLFYWRKRGSTSDRGMRILRICLFSWAATGLIYVVIHLTVADAAKMIGAEHWPVFDIALSSNGTGFLFFIELATAGALTAVLQSVWLSRVGWPLVLYGTPATTVTIDEYGKMAENQDWKFFLIDLLGIVHNRPRDPIQVLVDPEGYMKLHTAAAYLLGKGFASLYQGPKSVWNILREAAAEDFYPEVVKNKQDLRGERWVYFTDDASDIMTGAPVESDVQQVSVAALDREAFAIRDFRVHGRMKLVWLIEEAKNVRDFSVFEHREGCIVIRILENDVTDKLKKAAEESGSKRDKLKENLKRVDFHAEILWQPRTGRIYSDQVRRYLENLKLLRHVEVL
jgi:hypothetical protein